MAKIVRYQCHQNPDILCTYEMACAPCEYFGQNPKKLHKVTLKKKGVDKPSKAWRCSCGLPNMASFGICSCGKKRPNTVPKEKIVIAYVSNDPNKLGMVCPYNRQLKAWLIMVGSYACRQCKYYHGQNQHGIVCGPCKTKTIAGR